MLKLRLQKNGRKKKPFFRIILVESSCKSEGECIEQLGSYDPKSKQINIDKEKRLSIYKHLKAGAHITEAIKKLFNQEQIF